MARGKMPGTTPLQRTMNRLRQRGYVVAKVEQWIPRWSSSTCHVCNQTLPPASGPPGVRRDLFGIGDALAISGAETILVQACPMTQMGNHLAKMKTTLIKDPSCLECKKVEKDRDCFGHNAAGLWLAGEIQISEEFMLAACAILDGWTQGDRTLIVQEDKLSRLALAKDTLNASGPRRLELWGWRKLQPRGAKRPKWTESIRNITTDDLDATKGTVPIETIGGKESLF